MQGHAAPYVRHTVCLNPAHHQVHRAHNQAAGGVGVCVGGGGGVGQEGGGAACRGECQSLK